MSIARTCRPRNCWRNRGESDLERAGVEFSGMTKLCELIASIDQMDPEDVIFAKPEWHPDSEAKVFRLTEDYRVPDEAKAQG